jgi:hypothetical protein
MNNALLPNSRPNLTKTELYLALTPLEDKVDVATELFFVGIRGYYKKTMGDPTKNDRGIYDDAIFIVSPTAFVAFNANTEPSYFRRGYGTSIDTRGMARLSTGAWRVYKFDMHSPPKKSPYFALCQRAGNVSVMRDGNPDYYDKGDFGINIHRGKVDMTSSAGCQTIPPEQWNEFIYTAQAQAKIINGNNWMKSTYAYVLLEF